MLVQIAWRNIWRNKTRSFVVISSVIMGLSAGIFILAFVWGLYKSNISETVNRQLSHLQIHHTSFSYQQEPQYVIENSNTLIDSLKRNRDVLSVSARVISKGMISSPTSASGVKIYGISPESEKTQLALHENLIEGEYFNSEKENEIFIGAKLAKKLKVKLKSKVVLTFTDIHSNIVSAAFRITGIYRSKNTSLDEVNIYVQRLYLGNLLGLNPSESNEIAILLKTENNLENIKEYAKRIVPSAKVEDWKDLSPELELIIESFNLYTYIITGIILLALTFGIVNTMLMSVLERIRELGILMSIGLNKRKIFSMILLETLFLTLIGCPIGLFLGWSVVGFLGSHGINLAMFSEGLASYGFSTIIYPALEHEKYWMVAIMCLFTALLSAIYPAYRAIQLNPAQSIRKI